MRPDRAAHPDGDGGGERGSGSVLVLTLVMLAAGGLIAAVWLAGALHAQLRLRTAADLAALAAADRTYLRAVQPGTCPEDIRVQAEQTAAANQARVSGCVLDADLAVLVTVTPEGAPVRGSPGYARARAGLER